MPLEKRIVAFGRLPREGTELEVLLRDRGFQVYTVDTEDELIDVVKFSQPDVTLLAGRPGGALLARLISSNQSSSQSLIVVVWPGIPVPDALELFETGVDYVSGSYQPEWLAAQVRAALRRFGRERNAPSVIELGDLLIDLQRRNVTLRKREVPLTPTEFSILRVLAERPGTVLPSGEVLQQAMGMRISESEAQDILKVHIHRLRQKLEAESEERNLIRTVRGHGYMYAFERRSKDRLSEPAREQI